MKKLLIMALMLISTASFSGIKVGYADFTAMSSCPKFEEMASHGYTIVVYAFCKVDGDKVSIPQSFLGQYKSMSEMSGDMKRVKERHPGFMVFLSVGGERDLSTWNPGSATATQVASAMGKFADDNGFNGIDFDIETPVEPNYMKDVIVGLASKYPKLYISIAPQAVGALGSEINGSWDNFSKMGFVTSGWNYGYNRAIESGHVDYIWPQLYNNVWCRINSISERSVEYVKQLKKLEFNVNIPKNTLLIPGIPATKGAGDGVTGNATDSEIKTALENFPGTMVWSINADANNNWNMVTNVMP